MKSTPNRGVKKDLKPCAYDLSEPIRWVTACLLHNEPTSYSSPARLRIRRFGAEAKASLNRAIESVVVDAKPCDLPLARMKVR